MYLNWGDKKLRFKKEGVSYMAVHGELRLVLVEFDTKREGHGVWVYVHGQYLYFVRGTTEQAAVNQARRHLLKRFKVYGVILNYDVEK